MNNTNLKKTALIILATGFLSTAKAQKIAHLSFDSLISSMPETKTATDAAQIYLKGLEQEIAAMQTELETNYKDYLEKEAGMADLVKKNKQEALNQLQNRIQEFKTQAGQDYQRKQAELTNPIVAKAKKGIDMVAKEAGYKYVFDTSPQSASVLYSESSDNIFALVKKKLDTMPLLVIPGTAPAGTGGIKPSRTNKDQTLKGK